MPSSAESINSNTNRRQFLKSAMTWTAAVAVGAVDEENCRQADAAEKKGKTMADELLPIVDTHQHLWDVTGIDMPWLSTAPKRLQRSYGIPDYRQAAQGLNIVQTVYMEVNVHPKHQIKEAETVIDLCRSDNNVMSAAVIGGSPQSKEFKDYISKFEGNPYVKGVRTVLHDRNRLRGMCLEPQFVESIRLLGELGLSFDLCMRPDEILDGVKLVDMCPKTRFVVDHCGNMSVQSTDAMVRQSWMKGMQEMAQREQVVCKISGIVVTAKENWQPEDLAENVNFCLETFGEDRAYFAGDWPVCTLRASLSEWIVALKTIVSDRSVEFQRKLFHDNAVKFYGLTASR